MLKEIKNSPLEVDCYNLHLICNDPILPVQGCSGAHTVSHKSTLVLLLY